ncbi:MAG: hypothetical protein JNG84_14660 [Archangium sp.]|nr:hypothetical protein [Archangium sp.]
MPPDVLLALASSGLTIVASLWFFVSPDQPPRPRLGELVSYCTPPPTGLRPPPLPSFVQRSAMVEVTLRLVRDEWHVTLVATPAIDAPATRSGGRGAVHDLRIHGRAETHGAIRLEWKQKPSQA